MHRDRIMPAIALLNKELEVINVDNGTDYRRRTLEQVELYLRPLGEKADAEMTWVISLIDEIRSARAEIGVPHTLAGLGAGHATDAVSAELDRVVAEAGR